jgi:hypothetical protein
MYSNKHMGCVYYPIHKTSTTPLKKIQKIQKTQIFSQMKKYNANEIYIQKLLKKIPNYSSFFYTFQTCEPVNVGMMNQEDNMQQIDSDDSFVLLKYHRINYQSFISFLDSTNKSNKRLFDIYAYLLKSIQMLIKNNIVHSNICEKSIILNENNLPLLTMSQYSWCINDYDFNIKILESQPNVVIPFELFTIQYIIENKLTSISISNIYDICRHYKETLDLLVDIEIGVLFLKIFINKPSATIITELFKFAKTWDNYSLSIVFLRILQTTTTTSTNPSNKIIVDWINQLQTNINIDPRKRHSVETTYSNMAESRYHATVEDLR